MMWWGWLILGAVLLAVELFTVDAQFYLVFLGLSAALVGLLAMLGIEPAEWVQWMLFGAFSLLSFFTFRKSLYERIRGGAAGLRESLAGETLVVDTGLEPGAEGRIVYRGTTWSARNVGTGSIAAGNRVRIVRVDGIKLDIEGQ